MSAPLVVGTVELVECRAAEVHGTHRVADERVKCRIVCLGIACTLSEVEIFRSENGFAGRIVGIHLFPSARQGASVENHKNPEVVGIGKDILIELHHVLLVTSKEVHLDAAYAHALHPRHFGTTFTALIHLALR